MGGRILIADDEPNIVASLEFLLQSKDYETCVARDGAEALELVERFQPDLLLLDVMMPLVNGFEVCRAIRGNPAHEGVKIVMLSARGRDAERAQGLALGADAYVTKPFSTQELLAKVGELLPGL
ncbi:MAG TPA: response regulator [Burkholderiales bacterium]|jgi:DNA-binding response OmpR family regulator|nr:response regulator [Burkholderiales bacterium]